MRVRRGLVFASIVVACVYAPELTMECATQDQLGIEGDACDAEGNGCGAGLWCTAQACRRACCSDAECAENERCHLDHGQLGSFGTCA